MEVNNSTFKNFEFLRWTSASKCSFTNVNSPFSALSAFKFFVFKGAEKFTLIGLCLLFTLDVFSQKEPSLDNLCEISCLEGKHHETNLNGLAKSIVPNVYDLKYHELYLEIDPAVAYINGRITSTFVVTASGVDSIVFDLKNNMTVDSVKIIGLTTGFTQIAGDGLKITPSYFPDYSN